MDDYTDSNESNESSDEGVDVLEALRLKSELAFKDVKILHTMLHEYIPFFAILRGEAAKRILTELPMDLELFTETDQIKKYAMLRSAVHRADRSFCALEILHQTIIATEAILFVNQHDGEGDLMDDLRRMDDDDDLGSPDDGCPF